jgi:hypothetical protein
MSVVTNQQLFSHTYLAQLQADPSYDEAAAPIAQGLRDWLPSRDTSSLPVHLHAIPSRSVLAIWQVSHMTRKKVSGAGLHLSRGRAPILHRP